MIANNAGTNTFDNASCASNDPQLIAAESKFRAHVTAMRIRLVDLFADFDKLRSGYITAAQFRRCIGAAYDKGVVKSLSTEERELIVQHYLVEQDGISKWKGMIKWRGFVDSILNNSQVKSPTTEVARLVGHVLSPRSESILEDVLDRLRSYVKHHGYDVKSWFTDFDKYNNGYVTYNQFRRGIPNNLLSIEEEDILILRYGEDVSSTFNYFKMNVDVNRKAPRSDDSAAQLIAKLKLDADHDEYVPVGTEDLLHATMTNHIHGKRTLSTVEDKIKKYVYKNRIRLLEFFRDYDRHNCGLVSEAQFLAGLRLSSLPLEDQDIEVLKAAYQKDGRMMYRVFCASIDTVFTINHLEKDPLIDVKPPPREWLIQGSNELSADEAKRCSEIISKFRALMKERRLLLAPFFKDFDRGNLGRVTRSHFSRLLSMMKMDISDSDLYILFKKYEDRSRGKVSYMNFIRDIDAPTYRSINNNSETEKSDSTNSARPNESSSPTSISEIIIKIQKHVEHRRIRVAEFFRDFDRLRSYSIPRQEFIRGVDNIECPLTMAEFETLADHYQDTKKKGCCRWKEFETEVEKVFGDSNLESRPTHRPNPVKTTSKYASKQNPLSPKEAQLLDQTLANIRGHLKLRQSLIKPSFKDFDKVCTSTGHVTRSQFRRCLQYIKFNVTSEEFEVLCQKYNDPFADQLAEKDGQKGYIQQCGEIISYLKFLADLDAGSEEHNESYDAKQESFHPIPEKKPEMQAPTLKTLTSDECDHLIYRLKTKVKTERIRVIDFLADFDHMRHGKITKNEFRRGLKVVFSNLTESELVALENKYATSSGGVNYVEFSDELESVFTAKGLVKNPTCEVKEFVTDDPTLNILSAKDQKVYQKIIDRMVELVRVHVIDPLTYLEDYDFFSEGTISTHHFRSVLDDVGLPVDDEEIAVLAHRFATTKGMDRVNYRAFAGALMECAGLK